METFLSMFPNSQLWLFCVIKFWNFKGFSIQTLNDFLQSDKVIDNPDS